MVCRACMRLRNQTSTSRPLSETSLHLSFGNVFTCLFRSTVVLTCPTADMISHTHHSGGLLGNDCGANLRRPQRTSGSLGERPCGCTDGSDMAVTGLNCGCIILKKRLDSQSKGYRCIGVSLPVVFCIFPIRHTCLTQDLGPP
jgi:hypothetical protein